MIVALLSCYLEGPLAHAAIDSALETTDTVIVYEGPAGPALDADVPTTDYDRYGDRIQLVHGTWKTDAAKRTAMVEHCRRYRPDSPVWAVWIDGDEILVNGRYLKDHLDHAGYHDDPDNPWLGWPIKLVELDGGVSVCQAKVIRVDLIDQYSVSSSVFKTTLGQMQGRGNVVLKRSDYWRPFEEHIAQLPEAQRAEALDRVFLEPPIPCEPFLMHRSALRHPARSGVRMHEQEAVELEKAQLAEPERQGAVSE